MEIYIESTLLWKSFQTLCYKVILPRVSTEYLCQSFKGTRKIEELDPNDIDQDLDLYGRTFFMEAYDHYAPGNVPQQVLKRLPKEHLLKPLTDVGNTLHAFAARKSSEPDPDALLEICELIDVKDVEILNEHGYTFPWTFVCCTVYCSDWDGSSNIDSVYSYACDLFLELNRGSQLRLQDMSGHWFSHDDSDVVWKVLAMTTRALVKSKACEHMWLIDDPGKYLVE
eukprot:TRINITY_DN1917_c0_g2_i1.p1 TRINITY_DN1917_c0_g2~~TRINITY_DN1917_c0_g2_i1.p1  ORF type:complete len:226 (+),score=17.10 TRINITY_DN1917_c0_g2_i1:152-829(+)